MVSAEPVTITVAPDSELGANLRDAAKTGRTLIVDTGEAVYSLEIGTKAEGPDSHVPSGLDEPPSPEQVARSIEGIRKAAGSWKGLVDAEEFKAYIRERRRTKNRPPVRW